MLVAQWSQGLVDFECGVHTGAPYCLMAVISIVVIMWDIAGVLKITRGVAGSVCVYAACL